MTATLTHPTAIELKVVREVVTEGYEDEEMHDQQDQRETKQSTQDHDPSRIA